jgi:hypothetical protein
VLNWTAGLKAMNFEVSTGGQLNPLGSGNLSLSSRVHAPSLIATRF